MTIRQRLLAVWLDETGAVQSSWYGLTFEKYFAGTHTVSMESTSVTSMLVLDASTPAFDVDDFRDDVDQEVVTGSGYITGGKNLPATPAWTVASPGAGQMAYDSPDQAWAASTITNAEAVILFESTGTDTADELYLMSDFGSPVSTTNGTLTVVVDSNGWTYLDYTP
jgi:hypothetical protein